MGYDVIIRREAQRDIEKIFVWYEDKEVGLGHYFIICLDASIEKLARYPTVHRIVQHDLGSNQLP